MKKYRKAIAATVVAIGFTVTWIAGGPVSPEVVGAAWLGALTVWGVPNVAP